MLQRQPEPELMDLPDEASVYASADSSHIMNAFVERLLALVGDRPSLRVVDLGTGPASIPILIAQARPDWHITAVDASEAMLRIGAADIDASDLADRVTLHLADAKTTGLPATSFDLIICSSVLHHMPEPLPLWEEIKRLGKPGAQLFLRDLRRPESVHEVNQLVHMHAGRDPELLQDEFHRSLLSAFSIDEVREQLETVGLSSLKAEEVPDRFFDVFGELR